MPCLLSESRLRAITGFALILDLIFTLIYFFKHKEHMQPQIKTLFEISLLIVPAIYQIFGIIYFYPDHKRSFDNNLKEFLEEWKEEVVSPIKERISKIYHRTSSTRLDVSRSGSANTEPNEVHNNNNSNTHSCCNISTILSILILPFLGLYGIIILIPRLLKLLISDLLEFVVLFAYALYVNGALMLRFLNFMNYYVIAEGLGTNRSYLSSKNRAFITLMMINGVYIALTSFPTLLFKLIHSGKHDEWRSQQLTAIFINMVSITLQMIYVGTFKNDRVGPQGNQNTHNDVIVPVL